MKLHLRIIIFLLVIVSSADVKLKSHQSGIKGGSITFPDPLENGLFIFQGSSIAEVKDKKIDILEETYKDRLLWNNKTGLFTIRGLKRNDSGVYGIDPKKGFSSITSHKLSVYESVAAPAVEAVNVSAESCSFLCLVNKTEETTLLWYKDEEIINQSSSALSLYTDMMTHHLIDVWQPTLLKIRLFMSMLGTSVWNLTQAARVNPTLDTVAVTHSPGCS
nr:uncharacterized protein LOC110002751 isoform X1 [Labrus bergylta]